MKNLFEHRRISAGFTLVEMAIVLAIVALLLAGLLPTVSGQIEQARRNETIKQLNEIREALIGYAIVNGRLPCPAKGNIATGSANAGIADCSSNSTTGMVVPWATLGTSETDGWGRRFTYAVSSQFSTTFTLTTTGTLNVLNAAGGSNIGSNLPAITVSHGPNGMGAYTPQGIQLTASSNLDEADNSNGNGTFVSHDPVQNGFDDIVVWISPNTLFNRMVAAGKLP